MKKEKKKLWASGGQLINHSACYTPDSNWFDILKIHQNIINYSYTVDISASIRDSHQRKKLVPVPVMWSETVGLRKRPVWDQKNIGLGLGSCGLGLAHCGLGLAVLALFCETQSCNARRHNDLEGHCNFSSAIYSFSILCLEHHYSGDQQWRSIT